MSFKKRKNPRLKYYDYSLPGGYFVTICTYNRREVFGEISKGKMSCNALGRCAIQCWMEMPKHFPQVKVDQFVVMPNHVHGILFIQSVGTQDFASLQKGNRFGPQSKNLASIVRGFKIGVAKYARQNQRPFKWQSRYYDRIIRNEKELAEIRKYIVNNPLKWELDKNNPDNLGHVLE